MAIEDQAALKTKVADLTKQLGSKDYNVRTSASRELVGIGVPAVAALEEMLDNRDEHVRWEATKALGLIHDPAAADPLRRAAEDRNSDVRWAAAEALAAIGRAGVIVLLESLREKPGSDPLRAATHHVAHSLVRYSWVACLRQVMAAIDGPTPNMEIPIACKAALTELHK